jgi:tRNA modification GTPase
MNRLLKEERTIVTPVPGTTRDVIEESLDIEGLRVHLVDTAGIRETADCVEQEGIRRTRSVQGEADLQLLVVDGSTSLTPEDRSLIAEARKGKHVLVVNKSDLPCAVLSSDVEAGTIVCPVSALNGTGIENLKLSIRSQLVSFGGDSTDSVVVSRVRHQTALRRASEALRHAGKSVEAHMPAELVAVDVRAAADALGEITGTITTDEILERVFSEFCIGK